ncbi:MAG: hypothetical protein LCH63_02420 [Candidatus Melainabacteria bacterium]|nr:hypothetical protein [Candidatus Melainabacteria bacterium]
MAQAQAQDRIQKFLKPHEDIGSFPHSRCWIVKSREEADQAFERELKPWFAKMDQKLSVTAEKLNLPNCKRTVVFKVFLDKQDGSALPILQSSSGTKSYDEKALKVIRAAIPFSCPANDLPYQRGILIEFGSQSVNIKLAASS